MPIWHSNVAQRQNCHIIALPPRYATPPLPLHVLKPSQRRSQRICGAAARPTDSIDMWLYEVTYRGFKLPLNVPRESLSLLALTPNKDELMSDDGADAGAPRCMEKF